MVKLARQEQLDHLDQLVRRGQLVLLEQLEQLVTLDQSVRRGQLDLPE
jgi:hypothetical protein